LGIPFGTLLAVLAKFGLKYLLEWIANKEKTPSIVNVPVSMSVEAQPEWFDRLSPTTQDAIAKAFLDLGRSEEARERYVELNTQLTAIQNATRDASSKVEVTVAAARASAEAAIAALMLNLGQTS
jgi:uncharacterized protein YhaN